MIQSEKRPAKRKKRLDTNSCEGGPSYLKCWIQNDRYNKIENLFIISYGDFERESLISQLTYEIS